jgi:molybdopterin-guanine dinucleotide biosynthesis protein A
LGVIVATEGERATAAADIERLAGLLDEVAERVLIIGDTQPGAAAVEFVKAGGELEAISIAAALAGEDHALVLAADLAHPSAELIRYLVHVRAGHEAVVPLRRDGSPQPLCALYHGRCARRAEGLAATGERQAEALLDQVGVRWVTAEEVAKFGEPEELLARGAHPEP